MSLVQHVSAYEGIDRERDEDIDVASLQLGRRHSLTQAISYDPIPPTILFEEHLEPAHAYQVSTWKRIAQVTVGVLTCILASGITFGFAALKSVLVEEGTFRSLCTEDELDKHVHLCYLQDQRLNLMFIVASVTTNISALLVGATLDRYGPRACGFISSILLVIGSLFMAFAQDFSAKLDGFSMGFFLLALGGTFSFVPSFHLSNAFPRLQGLILALITGAFDSSSAVFLIFRLIYEATDSNFGPQKFFLIYLFVPVLIFVAQLFLMPSRSYETRLELNEKVEAFEDPTADVHDSDEEIQSEADIWRIRSERSIARKASLSSMRNLLGSAEQQQQFEKKEDEKKVVSGVWGALHGVPARKQIQSPWFILITLFTVLQMARFNFFIATIWSQYEYMLDSRQLATDVNNFFDLILPIGGVVTVPFIGLLLDNVSTVAVLALLVLLSTVIGALGAIPTMNAAYANVVLFCVFRPLYYSAMSDYAAKVFGFATFGTVYGTIICLSGVVVFTQPLLQAAVHDMYEDDPGTINLWLAGIGLLVGVALIMYVDTAGRKVMIEHAEEDERRSLRIGGASRRQSRSSLREAYTASLGGSLRSNSGFPLDGAGNGERQPLLGHKTSRGRLAAVEEGSESGQSH